MLNQQTTYTDTRGPRLAFARSEQDASSMQDIGKKFRKSEWLAAIRTVLSTIKDMRPGWDGYDAGQIPTDTVLFTFQILTDIWLPGLPNPDISPMSSDGIMIEWITEKCELTLEIQAPYHIEYFFENVEMEETPHGLITQDTRRLDPFLRQIIGPVPNVAVA